MRSLNLPTYSFKIKSEEGREYVFDNLRKKYLLLTPEEWVRQNFTMFLVRERNFPMGRIVLEKSLRYNNLLKRCDILVYDMGMNPVVLVECKAPDIKIDSRVFDQVAVYNMNFRVKYLMVTNGMSHYCARIDFSSREVKFLDEIPSYQSIAEPSEGELGSTVR